MVKQADSSSLASEGARSDSIQRPGWWTCHFGIDGSRTLLTIPTVLFLLLSGSAVWLWSTQRADEGSDIHGDTLLVASGLANRFQVLLQDETRPLRRLSREVGSGVISTRKQFAVAAESVQQSISSISVMAWIDPRGVVESVVSMSPTAELSIGKNVSSLPGWGEAFSRSFTPPRTVVVGGRHDGREVQWICVSILAPDGGSDRLRGAVIAQAALAARAADLLDVRTRDWFDLAIHDASGRLLYSSGDRRGEYPLAVSEPVRVYDTEWTLRLHPTESFVATRRGRAPRVVLLGGLALATLAALGVFQALGHRRRDHLRTAAHLTALEALARISEGITENPAESEHPLARMAEVAASLTDMPMRMVALLEPSGQALRIIHRQGFALEHKRTVYPLDETPLSQQCMGGRQIMMMADVEQGRPASISLLRSHGVRAFIFLPLLVSGHATGVILLASPRPRTFSALDRRLAELWVAQAAALLSNRKLYQRMDQAAASLRRNLEQREALYHAHLTIQRAGSLREALDRVAELAPRALDVDACIVALAHSERKNVQIAAITPIDPPHAVKVDTVVECGRCAAVIRDGQPTIVADTADAPVPGFPEMGSALFVPLRGSAATNGLLILLRKGRGGFDPQQVQTAELFAARAAAAVESARLHEQTRRQVETNSILLRELNHRVGNSLASIVGLLSMGAGHLPRHSRQWLDRAIERVYMMARAHELFSGGVQAIALDELLRTTLASVSAIKGNEVRISVDLLESDDLRLPSGQAVTLAMVLHELAYNAVVHALSEGGELIVRARRLGADRVAIEVIDRGIVKTPAGGSGRRERLGLDETGEESGDVKHAGIGLELVRNLVSRELRGSFGLTRAEDGGTVATVELPLSVSP